MFLIRALFFLEFFLCLVLFVSKKNDWMALNDLAIMNWFFIFSYPMVFVVLVLMVFVFFFDILKLIKNKDKKYIFLAMIDLFVPLVSYLIFESYYKLIGSV